MKRLKQQLFDRKVICVVLVVIFLFSLIPIIGIARYNHPSADDFTYGLETRKMWVETGSMAQVFQASLAKTADVYDTWQGSFAGVFLMTLQPAVFSEGLYFFVPIALLLFFCFSYGYLAKRIVMDMLGGDIWAWGIVSLLLAILTVQFTLFPVEAWFWYNGSVYYTGFYSLLIILIAVILKNEERLARTILRCAVAAIIGFILGGGNFVTALVGVVSTGVVLLYRYYASKKLHLVTGIALLAVCAGLLVSAVAPGNAGRQQFFVGMSPVAAILNSYYYGFLLLWYYVPKTAVLGVFCLIPLFCKLAHSSRYTFPLPGIATILLYSIYASSFTPNLYTMSSLGPERVANVNSHLAILLIAATLLYWCGWIAKKTGKQNENHKGKGKNSDSRTLPAVGGCAAILFSLAIVFTALDNPNSILSVSAARSLLDGSAQSYHNQYMQRLDMYRDDSLLEVRVSPFTDKPPVLFFDDVTENPGDWRNQAVAKFYSKQSVVLGE